MSARTESNWPVRKVGAGGVAGAVTTVLVYILNTHVVPNNPIPPEVATAFSTLLSFSVSYLTPPGKDERVINPESPGPIKLEPAGV